LSTPCPFRRHGVRAENRWHPHQFINDSNPFPISANDCGAVFLYHRNGVTAKCLVKDAVEQPKVIAHHATPKRRSALSDAKSPCASASSSSLWCFRRPRVRMAFGALSVSRRTPSIEIANPRRRAPRSEAALACARALRSVCSWLGTPGLNSPEVDVYLVTPPSQRSQPSPSCFAAAETQAVSRDQRRRIERNPR